MFKGIYKIFAVLIFTFVSSSTFANESLDFKTLNDFVGKYEVTHTSIIENGIEEDEEKSTDLRFKNIEFKEEKKENDNKTKNQKEYTLTFISSEDTAAKMKVNTYDHTHGDEEIGIDGTKMRILDIGESLTGWRRTQFSVVSSIQYRIVDTFSFSQDSKGLYFKQERIRYSYPAGSNPSLAKRNSTAEYSYTLKKL